MAQESLKMNYHVKCCKIIPARKPNISEDYAVKQDTFTMEKQSYANVVLKEV